jgi:hypothetical protein
MGCNTLLTGGLPQCNAISLMLVAADPVHGADSTWTAATPEGCGLVNPEVLDTDIKDASEFNSLNKGYWPQNISDPSNCVIQFSGPGNNGTIFVNAALVQSTLLAGGIQAVQTVINSYAEAKQNG